MPPSAPPQVAGRSLGQAIVTAANTHRRLNSAQNIRQEGGNGFMLGTSIKCPDEAFRPICLSHRAFPTVVVETAFTESDTILEFRPSYSSVPRY